MNTLDFLKQQVGVCKDFSGERLQQLVDGSRVVSFEANEAITHHGAEATHFGVVLSGTVTASVLAGGERQFLGKLKAGDTFGEMALMTGDTMLADFIADSRCEVLLIPVSLFQSVIVAEPRAVRHISRTIAERMKSVLGDPAKAAAALRQSDDPYGLKLKGERPEKILTINCGSSSLKYSFYDTADESRHAHGMVERIGIDGTRLKHHGSRAAGGEIKRELPKGGFPEAFKAMLAELTAKETGVISGAGEVSVVAHRVVHGGEKFTEGTLITDEVLAQIEAINPLAPLHNPVNVAGIREMRRLFAAVPHVAVFDTAFHHTLPAYAYLYGLPYELYEKKAVRRYGFHGTSHHYVGLRAAQFLQCRPNALRLVSCHLGNGSSLCAVNHGRSVDTTMGFTPAEGLIMGTRCGDVDAGVLAFLERTEGRTATQSEEMLNKKSGLLGLSGISSDMREILKAAGEEQPRALLALKTYCYRVRKYIGAYVASMGGLDVVVFTGGIGQGSAEVRALALQGLDCMGIKLDEKRNSECFRSFDEVCRITTDDSKVTVLVVPTDEERMMAREALRTLSRSYITLLTDLDRSRVLEVVEERTCEAADQLWETLKAEQKAAVEAVAVDMWEPFIQTIQKQVPAADIVHDRFHVSKYLNESVDKVRRQEHKELLAEGDETLKGTRQLWLYNPEHFSAEQRDEFSGLKDQQLKVARAWAMKELFSKFWDYQEEGWARRFFKGWFGWVSRSQLKPMTEVARLLKRHLENLLTYLRHHITNAVTEGLNSKIQSIKSAARGFRNFKNYRIRILFFCGKLNLYPL